MISELHSEPLHRSRTMWVAYVIDGLADGRFNFYIKLHHTVVGPVGRGRCSELSLACRGLPGPRDPPLHTVDRSPVQQLLVEVG